MSWAGTSETGPAVTQTTGLSMYRWLRQMGVTYYYYCLDLVPVQPLDDDGDRGGVGYVHF